MDWTKAKTILIAALLATNLFLFVTYVVVKADGGPTEEDLQAETIALLEEKQIYVRGELPLMRPHMPVLMVEYDRLDPEFVQEKLSEQTPLNDAYISREGVLKMTEAFLKSCEIWSSNVVLDKFEQDGAVATVSYRNEYEGILLEDSYIICRVENGMITEFERFWLKPVGLGESKKATISASAALINLMRSKDERTAIIVEDMEMVYWLNPTDYEGYEGEEVIFDTALPAWKVIYSDGQVRHIPAYSE